MRVATNLYDAEGNRVAKGTLSWNGASGTAASNWSTACSGVLDQNGWSFTVKASYILGPSGEQLTELSWNSGAPQWSHTNVFAAGQLIATLSPNPNPDAGSGNVPAILTNYYLTDWLGSRRVMTDANGIVQASCLSLPYGNGESCAPTPTEHLFTGKERDTESRNDYFGARYYSSTMGRWLSPDWSAKAEPVPYAKLDNPQSLNLYSYALNNPLRNVDIDGHCDSSANATANTKCQKISDLHVNDAYKNKLKAMEGEGKNHDPLLVYKDIGDGHHTVGWGHVDDSIPLGTKITKEDAQKLFDTDVSNMEKATADVLTANGSHQFSQGEFNALVDLEYNGYLLTSDKSPSLMKAMNAGDYDTMSQNLRYTKAKDSNGNVVVMQGLVDRSNDRESMFKGEDPQ